MSSRCETVSGSKLQLGAQTNTIWAKGDAGLNTMHSVSTYTDMYELTGGCEASICLNFTPETCKQTRLRVDMSPPSPP